MRKLSGLLVALLLVLLFSSVALAIPVYSLFNTAPESTLLSDNSADFLIDVNITNPGQVDPGDILVAMVGINTVSDVAVGAGTIYNEVTAITAVKIESLSGTITPNNPVQQIDMGIYNAQPLSAADSVYFDWSNGSILGGAFTFTTNAATAVNDDLTFGLVFEDSANDYTRGGTVQAGLDSATNGAYRLTLGLDLTASDFLQVIAPLSLADPNLLALAPNTQISLSSITADGFIIDQDWPNLFFNYNFTAGNGGFASPSVGSSWPIYDNLDFTLTATIVPEPSTFILLGVGLLGIGYCVRSRKQK